jgi:hypothetical protein
MAELKLKTVNRTQEDNRALKDGTVKPRIFAFEFLEVDPLIDAFRGLEFDITDGDYHLERGWHLHQRPFDSWRRLRTSVQSG